MEEKNFSSKNRLLLKRSLPVLRFLISLLLTICGGIFLFQSSMFNGLTSAIISLGLDTLRSQLVATLMMTTGSALIGAALGRCKLGAFVGAGIIFCNKFLISFFQHARQPLLDPGGHPRADKYASPVHRLYHSPGIGATEWIYWASNWRYFW